ncbi:KDEL motif-containing protein 1 [Cephus cinctus]|uniref:KDEL motif-containing protein 1 n=1 Tax=Cephus cinctus TaxID=211228 RepID=A0AAJ7C2R9_CEPCN|nr:KDEL motif-containing protein 1 [Cephus cinctus]
MLLLMPFILVIIQCELSTGNKIKTDIDPSKTIIWGPGLRSEEVVMRARYIFLQLYDTDGKNITESPGDGIVMTQIQGETEEGNPCHLWKQVFDCKDGSFIIRYKIYRTCYNLNIILRIKGKDVPGTPLTFKGPLYEEECDCPNPSITNWLNNYECPENYEQIQRDLAPFESVDFDEMRNAIIQRFDRPNSVSICHYIIKDNKVYRRCYGQHVDFKIFVDEIFLSLARKVILPNVELFFNLGDWPLVSNSVPIHPIFSWCGSNDTMDIVLPTYDITVASLENMGRVMLDMLSVQGSTNIPWQNKKEKLFWRGRDSQRERLDLIDIAREHPDLFNASITNFFFFKDEIDKYGPRQNHVSFFTFFEYKYQLNIDGTVAAYRFPFLLAGDSLVFKQDSKYYEYFYKDLRPYEHYVPVKRDLSDLVEKILWAKKHDQEAYKISRTGRQYARKNLLPQNIICYHVVLLQEWRKRLKNRVNILPNMEEVPQPEHACKCESGVNQENYIKSKDEL